MHMDNLEKMRSSAVFTLLGGVFPLVMSLSVAQAEVSPSLGAAVSGSFQAHLHVGGDPNSSGAQSTSDIIFSNLDKYGTTDFEAGASTILSEPSLLIVDTSDGNRLFGVSYAPIASAAKAKISSFVIESGDLKIKDSDSPAKEHKVSLSALSAALDVKSIYTANDKLTADRSVDLAGKTLTFKGANRDFSVGGTTFKISDLTDKTGKSNVALSTTSLQLNDGSSTAILSRAKGSDSPLSLSNTGKGGVQIDADGDASVDVFFTSGQFTLKSADGKGMFYLERSKTENGAVMLRNYGSGSILFNPSDTGSSKLEIKSSGAMRMAFYGKNTFPGDGSKDRVLSIDTSGNVRELTLDDIAKNFPAKSIPASAVADIVKNFPAKSIPASAIDLASVAKNLPSKSIPASALPDSALADTSLSTDNQKLTADRSIDLDGNTLAFNGKTRGFIVDGTTFKITDLTDTTGKKNVTLSTTSIKFEDAEKIGAKMERFSGSSSPLVISNTGIGGILFDPDGNGTPDVFIRQGQFWMGSNGSSGMLRILRDSASSAVQIVNDGLGSFSFNPSNKGNDKLEIHADGSVKLPYYGKDTFKGDLKNDRVLMVNASGSLREVPGDSLGTSLATDNQTLTGDRKVTMGKNTLTLDGSTVIGNDTNGSSDQALLVHGKARVTGSILSPIIRVSSDRRLKENIQPFNDGIDIIRQVKTYNFRFKEDAEKIKHFGVIAQEIEAIDPSLVSKFTAEESGGEYLSVHTNSLMYIMLDALKHLDAELTATRAEMIEMKADMLARIETLEANGN